MNGHGVLRLRYATLRTNGVGTSLRYAQDERVGTSLRYAQDERGWDFATLRSGRTVLGLRYATLRTNGVGTSLRYAQDERATLLGLRCATLRTNGCWDLGCATLRTNGVGTSLRYAQDERSWDFAALRSGRTVLGLGWATLRTNGVGAATLRTTSGNGLGLGCATLRTNGVGTSGRWDLAALRSGRRVLGLGWATLRTNGVGTWLRYAQDEWDLAGLGRTVLGLGATLRTNGVGTWLGRYAQDERCWDFPTPVPSFARYGNFPVRPEPFDKAQDRRSVAKSKDAISRAGSQ